jgi:hypothetical protein
VQQKASLKASVAAAPPPSGASGVGTSPHSGEFAVEDSLTKEKSTVVVRPEDAAAADARFKRVEELLADLHDKHSQQTASSAPAQAAASPAVDESLHDFLNGFEERLTRQLDASMQAKIHERFSSLEKNLQTEVRDALRDEIEAVQRDENELQHALLELQSLVQSREGAARGAVEDEFGSLQRQLGTVRDEIKAISPELYFRLSDGRILKNLVDLRDALKSMSPEVFSHHVSASPARNDFASWVEHALANPVLAQLLREQTNAQDMLAAVIAHDGMDD